MRGQVAARQALDLDVEPAQPFPCWSDLLGSSLSSQSESEAQSCASANLRQTRCPLCIQSMQQPPQPDARDNANQNRG